MLLFRAIPWFILLLGAYNVLMVSGDMQSTLATELFAVDLISGAHWTFNVHHLFMVAGVAILYLEIFKSTRTGMASVIDHTLSTGVFIAFVVEFLTVADCGTSTFFILASMALIDVIAGFTVSIVAARRDFAVGGVQT
jgi:hypothetical protein